MGQSISCISKQVSITLSKKNKGYFILSLLIPGRRGGPFGRGGRIRIDWIPKAGPTFSLGLEIPIGQKSMGETRPRMDHVRLPKAPKPEEVIYKPTPELEESLRKIRFSADWINRFTTPFFDQKRKTDKEHMKFFREKLKEFKDLADYLESQGFEPKYLAQDQEKRKPKLHFKTQFFGSFQALSSLLEVSGWGQLIRENILAKAKVLESDRNIGIKEVQAEISKKNQTIVEEWYSSLSPEQHEKIIFYLTVGSHNQDYRSKIQDGEVIYVVSHLNSLIGYLDFIGLIGRTTWVDTIEEMEELLPRYTGFMYNIGRYIRNAL